MKDKIEYVLINVCLAFLAFVSVVGGFMVVQLNPDSSIILAVVSIVASLFFVAVTYLSAMNTQSFLYGGFGKKMISSVLTYMLPLGIFLIIGFKLVLLMP